MIKILSTFVDDYAKPVWHTIQKRLKIQRYKTMYPAILKKVKNKDKINIVFFVINVGMWKSDALFQLLLKDNRFNPCIISFLYPEDSIEYQKYVQESLSSFFAAKGYPYLDCYDFNKNEWLDIHHLEPDIIFYAQPYNAGYKQYQIESFWKTSLFAYIPYCLEMEKLEVFYNLLLQNIAWKLFYPTEFHFKQGKKHSNNKGRNIDVCGYPMADYLVTNAEIDFSLWPEKQTSIKRVIWAPHHTILSNDVLHYSNFLELAESMLNVAKEYRGKVQFAFKPHPRLMTKLYSLWGKTKTDAYYQAWNNGVNTTFVEGDYVDLFRSSDALIHDCSSFMGEYLFTGKPLMFVAKTNCDSVLNDFGRICFEQHYKGSTIEDIKKFIDNVVIRGVDPMKEERFKFYKEQLLPPNNMTVAQNIYNDLVTSLFGK